MELKSTVGLNKTIEDIKKGTLVPVYLIFGDEDYLVKEAAQRIIDTILPGKGRELNLETKEGDEEDWDKIIQSLNTFPLFGSGRVVAVKDTKVFFSKFTSEDMLEKCRERFKAGDLNEAVRIYRVVLGYKGLKDITDKSLDELPGFTGDPKNVDWLNAMVRECTNRGLKPILYEDNSDKLDKVLKKGMEGKGIPKGNVLVLTAEHVDKRKKLLKTINDIGIIIDFSIQRMRRDPAEIEDEEKRTLQQQANELLRETGKKLTKGAFDALLAKTGFDVGMFLNEVAKVIVSTGDRQQIEPRDIEEIVGRSKEDSIFDLQKAVGRRDFEKATFYVQELMAQGEFYLSLLQSIAGEIRNLIVAKEFIENELKAKWNPKLDVEGFKRSIYFPVVVKMKKEPTKGHYNILNRPPDVLLELLKSSEKFTRHELYRSIKLLAETDLKMKSTRLLPIRLLERALMEICLNKGKEHAGSVRPTEQTHPRKSGFDFTTTVK